MRGRIKSLREDLVVSRRTAFLTIGVVLMVTLLVCSVSSYMIVEWRALFAARDPVQRLTAEQYFEARNRLFTTAVGLIGAVGLLGTLFFTWRNFLLAESGQITDRFAKAVELLGATQPVGNEAAPNLEARLGAIYALERIAQDSERDHWQVIEVLAAYLRNATPPVKPTSSDHASDDRRHVKLRARADTQAALTVIARRKRERDLGRQLDLQHAHLEGVSLRAVHIESTLLSDAHLEDVELVGVVFNGAVLERAHFDGASLDSCKFERARLDESSWRNSQCPSVGFAEAHLSNADFEGAYLRWARFESAILVGANLAGADLVHANLNGTILAGASLEGADLSGATLDRAVLSFPTSVTSQVGIPGVAGLTQAQLDSTASYKNAKNLPPHLKPDNRSEVQTSPPSNTTT